MNKGKQKLVVKAQVNAYAAVKPLVRLDLGNTCQVFLSPY